MSRIIIQFHLAIVCLASLSAADDCAFADDVMAHESIVQKTAVQRQAGGYAATVTLADAAFGLAAGDQLTVVIIPAQESNSALGLSQELGQVGVRFNQETVAFRITTAEGGKIGFLNSMRPDMLGGCIRVDKIGSPVQLVLTRATLEGLLSAEASLERIQEPQ